MGRSGQLICKNDHLIYKLLADQNYEVRADGTVWTRITKTGKVSVNNVWREAGSTRRGYRTLKHYGVMLQIHRIIYAKFNGPLEEDLVVMHQDDNGLNNLPENLKLGTQSQNNFHRFREGSGHYPVIGNKVLNWEKVREIRRVYAEGNTTYQGLCWIYEISKGHVSQIINNEIWIEGKQYADSATQETVP